MVLVDHEWYGTLLVVQAGFRMMGPRNKLTGIVMKWPG